MRKHWKIRHHRIHRRRQRAPWFLLFLMLAGGWFFFSRPSTSNAQERRTVAMQPATMQSETYWSDDVTVSEGQTIDGDLVVYSGDVTIESGGRVSGSVINYSGDVTVEEGGIVSGDLTVWSGSVTVDGTVNGSIAAWSGDVDLAESAIVKGDVSAMSGSVDRGDGAQIAGSVIKGPGFKWPGLNPFSQMNAAAPIAPEAPTPPRRVAVDSPSAVSRFFSFILRVIGAVFFSAIASLLAALVFNVRPELVSRIRTNLHEQPVYAAVAGAVLNVPMLLVAGLLAVTFCLAPLALPPLLLLVVLNLVGLTGIAQIAGERLTKALNLQLEPVFVVGLGAFAVVGGLSMLWAFGGCFRGIAWIVGFVGGSMGVGALIMPWLKNFSNGGATNFGNTSPNTPPAPVAPDPIAPDPITHVEVTIGGDGTKPAADVIVPEVANAPVVPPVDVQIAEPTPVADVAPVDAPVEAAAPAAQTTAEIIEVDDFTIIKGIGSVLDRRLKEAGVLTFAQFAELAPERMAEICDRPLSWILEDDLLGQAKYFAEKK